MRRYQRAGLAEIFARIGFAVFVLAEPNNAISGFPVVPFAAVKTGQEQPPGMPSLTSADDSTKLSFAGTATFKEESTRLAHRGGLVHGKPGDLRHPSMETSLAL
jgi:hypothetical protein